MTLSLPQSSHLPGRNNHRRQCGDSVDEWLGSSWDNNWNITRSINPSEKKALLKLGIVPYPSNDAGLESQRREGG